MVMSAGDLVIGASAGIAANEASTRLHPSPTGKEVEEHLSEIHTVLCDIERFFKNQPVNKMDAHKTLNLFNNLQSPISFDFSPRQCFLTLHILVPTACTLTATISGVGPVSLVFASAPTAGQYPLGQYIRWRFPDRVTTLTLTSPIQTTAFPIDLLYSDELGD